MLFTQRCPAFAADAPTEDMRQPVLSLAHLSAVEADSNGKLYQCISESRELIVRMDALLGTH